MALEAVVLAVPEFTILQFFYNHVNVRVRRSMSLDKLFPPLNPGVSPRYLAGQGKSEKTLLVSDNVLRPSCYLGAMRPLMPTFTSLLPYLYDRAAYSRLPDSLRT